MYQRFLLFLFLLIPSVLTASNPLRLVVKSSDGSAKAFAASHLVISIQDEALSVENEEQSATFKLGELEKMYFSTGDEEYDSITLPAVDFKSASPVEVFSPSGAALGKFKSAAEAAASLNGGVYIFKTGKNSFKLNIK